MRRAGIWRGDELPLPPRTSLRLRPEERHLLWPFLKRARLVEEAALKARGDRILAGRLTPNVRR